MRLLIFFLFCITAHALNARTPFVRDYFLGDPVSASSITRPNIAPEQEDRETSRKNAFFSVKSAYMFAGQNAIQYLITSKQVNAPSNASHQTFTHIYRGSIPRTLLMLAQSYASAELYTHIATVTQDAHSFYTSGLGMVGLSIFMSPLDFLATQRVHKLNQSYQEIFLRHKQYLWAGSFFYGMGQGMSWFVFLTTLPMYEKYTASPHAQPAWIQMAMYSGALSTVDVLAYCPLSNARRFAHIHPEQPTYRILSALYTQHGLRAFWRGGLITGVSSFFNNCFSLFYYHLARRHKNLHEYE